MKNRNVFLSALLFAGACLWSSTASAQEFLMHQGGPNQPGKHNGSQTADYPGKAFLRWWDPLFDLQTIIDQWEPAATQIPAGSFFDPGTTEAGFAEEKTPPLGTLPYKWSDTVASTSFESFYTSSAAINQFEFDFTAVTPGLEYAVAVNVPVGPTDVDPSATSTLKFQARYQVYKIEGVLNTENPGQPIFEKVDVQANGGGWMPLGNSGAPTAKVYEATGTSIKITLINTIVRDSQNNLVDTPGQVIVYADAARLSEAVGSTGVTVTSPIVARLKASPAAPFQWRTYNGRMESFSTTVNNTVKDYSFPTLSAFTHNGTNVIPTDTTGRRNLIWSWPAFRPSSTLTAEQDRYTQEKTDWLEGVGKYPGAPRFDQSIVIDDSNGNALATGTFVADSNANSYGAGHLSSTSPGTVATDSVTYRPFLPEGNYFVEVFVPGGGTAQDVQVEVVQGAVVVATIPIDQSTGNGFKRLSLSGINSWASTKVAPLSISITNGSSTPGEDVIADSIRFVKTADLSMTSTPAYGTVDINDGGTVVNKDVVYVALENGKIYCIDAAGQVNGLGVPTGDTKVYWTYPSETAIDPDDAVEGVSEKPAGFNFSSPILANIGGQDFIFVGTTNGRVYCLEASGDGTGTATRRWTFPDDFPTASVESTLGRIGTLAFENTAEGPTLFVPTEQGRLYAIDALGNAATRTTSVRWAYPSVLSAPIGPISMAPVVAFNSVYFGTGVGAFGGSNTFFCIRNTDSDLNLEGDLLWSTTTIGGQPLDAFGIESPVAVSAADLGGFMPNTVFFGNKNFFVGGFNAATGAELWSTDELGVSPSSSVGFTYLRTFDTLGNLRADPGTPMIMVPTVDGRYTALYADTGTLNVSGDRAGWSVSLSTDGFVPSMAFGGKDTTIFGPTDDEYSWMYGADAQGYVYGFNYDLDFTDGNQGITPGTPPVREEPGGDDNLSQSLGDAVRRAKVSLVTPNAYRTLLEKQRAGTLTYADISAEVNQITRKSFEFGESLYFVVYDLPDPAFYTPPMTYTVEIFVNTPGQSVTRRAYSAYDLVTSPSADRDRCTLIAMPLIPSGGNAVVPGKMDVTMRLVSAVRNGANRTIPKTSFQPSQDPNYEMSNPMGISTIPNPVGGVGDVTQIGYTTDAKDSEAIINGNNGKVVAKGFSPDLNSAPDNVAHGNTAVARLYVWDRSLVNLVYGPGTGLQSVRMQLDDLQWLGVGAPAKALSQATYPGLEDRPGSPGNNRSLDYPDMRRDRINVTKSSFGAVENPQYQAVRLLPPLITAADQTSYESNVVNYNDRLTRTLVPTNFDFSLDVPRFQPPSPNGYGNDQVVYVDGNAPGFQPPTGTSIGTEAYRQFDLNANIAVDERIRTNTPTLDLQSLPAGAGFSPAAPWNNAGFRLADPIFHDDTRFPFFQKFEIRNEGNVNLLNVRVAKRVQLETGAVVPVMFFGGDSMSPLAQLDARWHMHNDLDERFLGWMPGNRAILQKPRPGDGEGTRLRVNPKRRANVNLNVTGGDFVPSGSFLAGAPISYGDSIQDPRLGVSVPIGTPVGEYRQDIDVIEDTTNAGGANATYPIWDLLNPGARVWEPAADDPIQVRFEVRETRMTTNRTNKAQTMLDNNGGTNFSWTNTTPAAVRTGNGNLIVAFSSDRLTSAGVYGFNAANKQEADTAKEMKWRIYIATIAQGGTTPTAAVSPMSDISQFSGTSPTQWMTQAVNAFPPAAPSALFNIPDSEIVRDSNGVRSVSFTNPAFPAMGVFEPVGPPLLGGRPERNTLYMAFTGEALRNTAGGERIRESRLFIVSIVPRANGAVDFAVPVPLEFAGQAGDGNSRFGRPSIVQLGDRATAFYTLTSGSSSQLCFSSFDGTNWVEAPGGGRFGSAIQSLQISSAFESVSSPTATMRHYLGTDGSRAQYDANIELSFIGRLKGRSNPEAYLGRIRTRQFGATGTVPQLVQGQWFASFPTRLDPLVLEDPSTGLYWVNGIQWQNNLTPTGVDNPLNPFSQSFIDVKRLNVVAGVARYETILVNSTRATVEGSNLVTYDTVFGGKAYVDLASGSVRFSGAIIPRNMKLFVRYAPKLIRISSTLGVNYRGVNMVYDDRFADTGAYYGNPGGNAAGANEPYRNDRFVMTFGRSASGNPDKSRPSMKTMRFGIQLPTPVATDANGRLVNFNINAGAYWQVEPATGKVFVNAEAEDRNIGVTYQGVDESGRPLSGLTTVSIRAGLIEEQRESNVPIQQVGNESMPWIGLDPLGSGYNTSTGANRRPNLLWFFWTSTRGGGSDIYFETVAPRFGSIVPGR